ncbi:unnamed protein product [Rotaria socialis]|uniref:Uncharacterized protein n=1 Tax=Rotaria socialis TaxID=392032 RepID=A0A821MGL2_9BILA|nr:unnamed protein product [Rotaria socialis]
MTTNQCRLNYEEQNQYKIRIKFSNQAEAIEKDFLITIEDINEAPYDLQCSNHTGICTVFDDDFNQTLNCGINTKNDFNNKTSFEIMCTDNGQPPLSVSTWIKVLPNDMTLMVVPIFSLIIPVDDNYNTIDKHTRDNIVISYSNDGDKTEQQRQRRQANLPPQDIFFNVSHLSVPENAINFNIAHVYIVDEDNDNYTCSIQTHNSLQHQQPFEIVNGILRTKSPTNNNNYDLDFDFETTPVYNTTVSCADLIHHFTINKNFSIFVTDVNEAPVELTLTPNILPENSPAGFVIGQLHAIDPDIFSTNGTFQYTLITDIDHIFTLENDNLVLSRENYVEMCMPQPDLCPHDYEQTDSLLVRIFVEDNGEPRASQKFWMLVKITDENDPPVNLVLDKTTVKENSPIGTLVGSFSVDDQDLYQTHIYTIISENSFSNHGNLFSVEDNDLRLIRSPDYEQDEFILITVHATDNGIPPKSITSDFLVEIIDIDEFPTTYIFISNIDNIVLNDTINNLINGENSVRTTYLPQNAYTQASLGKILFLIEDRDQDIDLNGYDNNVLTEFGFSKPTCDLATQIPYRLLCASTVTVAHPQSEYDQNALNGHLVVTSLTLISNNKTMNFSKLLRIKFENITLTINGQQTESVDIPRHNAASLIIGSIDALDLAAGGQRQENITLNPNSSLSYPLEIINSTILKIRDDENFSSSNMQSIFNVSVFVTTVGEESRLVEKYLIINVKNKYDFNLTLTNNKILENSHENTSIGNFIVENGIGDYTIDLVNNSNGKFKLYGTNLLTATKYVEHCHLNHSCALNYETEPRINITVAVLDPLTNETLRLVNFSIEVQDENEPLFNLSLSNLVISENTTIGSTIGIINAIDLDFNQTKTFTTMNPTFAIEDNRLILKRKLIYDIQQHIPIIIQATDNGQPPISIEKLFIINITAINRPPINVTSSLMTGYIERDSENKNSTGAIVGQIYIMDPDLNENFTIVFNKPNFRALEPARNSYSIISDDDFELSAEVYNISILDVDLPNGQGQTNYSTNVIANITDLGGHSVIYEFVVDYAEKSIVNASVLSIFIETTTVTGSLFQALHARVYEITPPNTPIIHGVLRLSSLNNSLTSSLTCTATDDQENSFGVETTVTDQLAFIVSLPDNYTLNSTIHPIIIVNVQCNIGNDTNVNQDIVVDVLPAPPTVEINFNQTETLYAANPINNETILGRFDLIELTTTTPTNRTYNLSLVNYQDTFQLLPNHSLIQIGQYPPEILDFSDAHVNLNVQVVETTPGKPTRIIQRAFQLPIIINSSTPLITFSQSSIANKTQSNTTIGSFSVSNISILYQLQLLDTYNDGLELDSNSNSLILKRPINTFPLINNQTQLELKVALTNETNGTILLTTFPLRITYENIVDFCLHKDCGNGTCIHRNETVAYCLCTGGYTGIDCRGIDACAYSPCTNNGICHQLSSDGKFSCQCIRNYTGAYCEISIDICQLNKSSCPSTDICIPTRSNLSDSFKCIPRDELQYFVFDYLNNYKNIDIVNNENFPENVENFLKDNLPFNETTVLSEIIMLGPQKYSRAQLISAAIRMSDDSSTTFSDALEIFCNNISLAINSFTREVCAGYQQAAYLDKYFKSTPSFCPNCTFIDAADKYYWFDKILPFLPLWISVIIGSVLMAAVPLISFSTNTPKKAKLPVMKANRSLKDEESLALVKTVRSAGKITHSHRERNDSGYESNENTDSYLGEIINNHQQEFHVYPVSLRTRSRSTERRGTTIDDLISQNHSPVSRSTSFSNNPRRYIQRSVSMSPQKTPRQSSVGNSQTLKPIIRRRSTLFDSSFGSLMRLTGTPRLNNDDDTYVSSRFRNENTSKFVIGTLWNTFALINNLFLQRPRDRRNALFGDTNIQAEQLAHLEQLYSLAERDQANETGTNHLESILEELLSELKTNKTKNLQSIILDILSSVEPHHCTCYGNHHLHTCIYYDHSLPYVKTFAGKTSQLETIFRDIQNTSKPRRQEAATQSCVEKPHRTFQHYKPTTNISTQSSPILNLKQWHSHASTQYSPMRDKNNTQIRSNLKEIDDKYNNIDVATQTMENKKNGLIDISTQFSPITLEDDDDINFLIQRKLKANLLDDHVYMNASTQFSPILNEDVATHLKSHINNDAEFKHTNASTQFTPTIVEDISTQYSINELEDIKPKYTNNLNQVNLTTTQDNNLHHQRSSLMHELKQILSSPIPKQKIVNQDNSEKTIPPTHSVRSLVSMFETTSIPKESSIDLSSKPFKKPNTNTPKAMSPLDSTHLRLAIDEASSSIVDGVIEQYANEMASNIIENAVSTGAARSVYHNEHQQRDQKRRFSLYNNNGGKGKSLLFQSNTFVPANGTVNQGKNQDFRAESAASITFLNDPLTSTKPPIVENESQHTLIVGRYTDGDDINRAKPKKYHSLAINPRFDLHSSSSSSSSLNNEKFDNQHYLSSSQLFTAQKVYIRPWVVRRATISEIHCLDNNVNDTRVEAKTPTIINSPEIFFNPFPNNHDLDMSTRYTCLIAILLYLEYIYDENSNKIVFDELNRIEKQFFNDMLTPIKVDSNVFQTVNPDGSKRYRTGFTLGINSSDFTNKPKIFAKQINWKSVKIIIRRFRKKYQHHKQLIKNDQKRNYNQSDVENYLKYFDSKSKHRMKKYAKHYAEKI